MLSIRRPASSLCFQLKRCLSPKVPSTNTKVVGVNPVKSLPQSPCLQNLGVGRRSFSHQIVDGSDATYKPSPFQRKVLVWTKTYAAEKDIPDRIRRGQMKKAMDKFRVKASIYMVGATLVFAAMMAFIGRKARHEGVSVGRIVLERREKFKEQASQEK